LTLIKKLRKSKKEAQGGEKPDPVRTHVRNMIVVPEMIGSIIGVYNGKTFNQVRGSPHPHTTWRQISLASPAEIGALTRSSGVRS
jgi:ribosomal protein uS19